MNKHFRKMLSLTVVAATVLLMVQVASPAKAQKTVVTWFVGLGTGGNSEQKIAQEKVVADFNASQDKIELKINIADNKVANDVLSTLIASGDAPDVIGPVGFEGSNRYSGQWLDLTSLVEKSGYDMKQFPEALVNLYKTPAGLVGIPFAVFPGLLYYNVDLFDEAGLAYPPSNFDEKYTLDGKEVDWNYDTMAEVAKRLTVDTNGNDATSAEFDPSKIAQFGFNHQWALLRSEMSTFGGGEFWDAATNKVSFPENWKAELKWLWNGVWKDHFIPTATYDGSDLLKPSAFASGKVAMARVMLWYTCCMGEMKAKWDLGVVPSYNGKYYAPADADTYRIMNHSKNPEAAFTVLQYLLGPAAGDLLTAYGAYPARPDLQAASIESKAKQYPSVKNWAIVPTSLAYAVSPSHESDFPNYAKGQQRFNDLRTLIYGDTGKDLDLDKEIDKLVVDLQGIIDEAVKK